MDQPLQDQGFFPYNVILCFYERSNAFPLLHEKERKSKFTSLPQKLFITSAVSWKSPASMLDLIWVTVNCIYVVKFGLCTENTAVCRSDWGISYDFNKWSKLGETSSRGHFAISPASVVRKEGMRKEGIMRYKHNIRNKSYSWCF